MYLSGQMKKRKRFKNKPFILPDVGGKSDSL